MELHTHTADADAIGRTEIAAADRTIRPYIRRTPVIAVDAADFGAADRVGVRGVRVQLHTIPPRAR